jgi:hypothetical protein
MFIFRFLVPNVSSPWWQVERRCLLNTAHQFFAGQVKREDSTKPHGGQPSGTPGFGPNDELDCPVPRLTLLFFGAATDVPEAAKMVTAGTACLYSGLQAEGQTGC